MSPARCSVPGFVDCHTHLVFGGERVAEFERKLAGATYQELLAAGGGILATMRATRAASHAELVKAGRAVAGRDVAARHDDGRDQERLRAGHRH
jgi:imidazolonepropionase-like amidohydrolase